MLLCFLRPRPGDHAQIKPYSNLVNVKNSWQMHSFCVLLLCGPRIFAGLLPQVLQQNSRALLVPSMQGDSLPSSSLAVGAQYGRREEPSAAERADHVVPLKAVGRCAFLAWPWDRWVHILRCGMVWFLRFMQADASCFQKYQDLEPLLFSIVYASCLVVHPGYIVKVERETLVSDLQKSTPSMLCRLLRSQRAVKWNTS